MMSACHRNSLSCVEGYIMRSQGGVALDSRVSVVLQPCYFVEIGYLLCMHTELSSYTPSAPCKFCQFITLDTILATLPSGKKPPMRKQYMAPFSRMSSNAHLQCVQRSRRVTGCCAGGCCRDALLSLLSMCWGLHPAPALMLGRTPAGAKPACSNK